MVPEGGVHFWLWVVMVATAVMGGILAIAGAALEKKEAAAGARKGVGHRVMLASYGFMTASMLAFAARGFM